MTVDEFIKKHGMGSKEHWINYCEVVITQNGEIFEATPSHSEWLYRRAESLIGCTRSKLYDIIPVYASPMHWIAERFDFLVLWYDFGIGSERVLESRQVKETLRKLRLEGLVSKDIEKNIGISHEYSICQERERLYSSR